MVFTQADLGLRDREFHKFVGAPGAGSEISVSVVIASGNITIGSVSAEVDSVYVTSGAVGAHVISGVPTEVSGAVDSYIDFWTDTFGRQVIKGTNLGQEALDVNEIAPALLQTINTVNLSAVGSVTGSNVGAWVNVSDFGNKTVYLDFTSGTTGSMHTTLETSPDAGSTAFELTAGSLWLEADTKTFVVDANHHEFIRMRTDFNEGGTLTATVTGRGGR